MDKEASHQDGLELRCPQRPIIRFSEVPSTHCGSESLGDICLLGHNEPSSGQTSICHRSRETRGVRRIEGAAGHVEIASVSPELHRRCDSIKLDCWAMLTQARNYCVLTLCFLMLNHHILQSVSGLRLFFLTVNERGGAWTPTIRPQ